MSRRAIWVVLLAAAVVPYLLNLGATSIIDANEAFYTETPREMLERGTWLESTFNYEPRYNKPPLSYWVVLASYHVFGVSLWAARLPIAIGALLMIGTAFALGRAAFSVRAGWIAAVTLAATPRFFLFARRIMIDVWSSMFLGLTLLCFVLAETDPPRRRRWLLAMYVTAGLGVLTKGPIAVVIPALVFGLYLLGRGRLRDLATLRLPTGAAIVAAIVAPYYAALYARFGWDYIATFFIRENLARYAEGVGAPNRGPWFYLPVLFGDLYFPWSLLLPVALVVLVPWGGLLAWRRARGAGAPAAAAAGPAEVRLLLGLWIAGTVGFYSLSQAQQDLYILPVVTAAAALVAGLIDQVVGGGAPARARGWTRGSLALMAVVLGALGAAAAWGLGDANGPIHLAGARAGGVLLAAGAAVTVALLWRRGELAATAAAAGSVIAVLWVLMTVSLPDFERYKPVPRLAQVIETRPEPVPRVCTFKVAAPSLVFYLRRHVDQLFDDQQLIAYMAAEPGAYCIMRDNDLEAVRPRLPHPVTVVAGAPRFEARLRDFLDSAPLPNLVLVTAETRNR